MLFNLIENIDMETVYFIGILFSIAATFLMLGKFNGFLPKDQGKEFAVGGMASKGKIRGAGISFIIVYCVAVALFSKLTLKMSSSLTMSEYAEILYQNINIKINEEQLIEIIV